MQTIDPRVIRTLRKKNKLTQGQLAEKLGVSKRQVAEWERERKGAPPVAIRDDNAQKLGQLFRVTKEQLAGKEPFPTGQHGDAPKQQITVRLTHQARLNYDLVERRYGVSRDKLIEATPMLFALLARQSLEWREEQLERHRKAIGLLQEADEAFVPPEIVESYVEFSTHALDHEEEALKEGEIFTPSRPDLNDQLHFGNRFADYLISASKNADIAFDLSGPISLFPDNLVLTHALQELCGGPDAPEKDRAAYALASGAVKLSDIPADLLSDDVSVQRSEWIAARAPVLDAGLRYAFEEGELPGIEISQAEEVFKLRGAPKATIEEGES